MIQLPHLRSINAIERITSSVDNMAITTTFPYFSQEFEKNLLQMTYLRCLGSQFRRFLCLFRKIREGGGPHWNN